MKRIIWTSMIIFEFAILGFFTKIGFTNYLVPCFLILSFIDMIIFSFFYFQSIKEEVDFEWNEIQRKRKLAVSANILFLSTVLLFIALCIYIKLGNSAEFIVFYAAKFTAISSIIYCFIEVPISFIEETNTGKWNQCTSNKSSNKSSNTRMNNHSSNNTKIECKKDQIEKK